MNTAHNTSIPFYFEMPAGFTTIHAPRDDKDPETAAQAAIAYAQVFREETGRVVGLLRRSNRRLAVIVKVSS